MADKDTTNKRRFTVWALPAPDGSIGQADRQHKVWKYPGILTTETAGPSFCNAPFRLGDMQAKFTVGDNKPHFLVNTQNQT